jgi:hypothetical protein
MVASPLWYIQMQQDKDSSLVHLYAKVTRNFDRRVIEDLLTEPSILL